MKPGKYGNILDTAPWVASIIEYFALGEISAQYLSSEDDDRYRRMKEYVRERVKSIGILPYSQLDLNEKPTHTTQYFGEIGCLYATDYFIFYNLNGIKRIQVLELEGMTCEEALVLVREHPEFKGGAFLRMRNTTRTPLKEDSPVFPSTLELFLIPTAAN